MSHQMSHWIRRWPLAIIIAALLATGTLPARAQDLIGETRGLKGAGSTLVYPLLSLWSREYRAWQAGGGEFPAPNAGLEDPPATSALVYEAVGSLAGTLRVKEGAVDFGASDMPLKSQELASFRLAQFPIVVGGVAVALNVAGIGKARVVLSGPVIAAIFLGNIQRWSDPALAALNPSLRLPDAPITVIHRSDGSGTTFNFTDYLLDASAAWKPGSALSITWPVGVGAKGNDGVARTVQATENSIGYLDYAQARQLNLHLAAIQNRAGKFVEPSPESFRAAAGSATFTAARDFHVLLTDASSPDAYPITATVFVLMPRPGSADRTGPALEFFRWCLDKGQNTASRLGYVPLPAGLVQQVSAYWAAAFAAR